MNTPRTREEAAATAVLIDADILALRRRGMHAAADTMTRQRDALVKRWAAMFDAEDRGRRAAE